MPHVTSSDSTPQLSPTDEKARAAVRVFRGMQPTLSAFARNLTGINTVRVEMSPTSNGHTDGKVIYFRPPIALGDMRPHDRNLCDRREPDTGLQLCLACNLREQVLVTIYHEISHIAFGTFDKADDKAKSDALKAAIEGRSDAFAKVFKKRLAESHTAALTTYLGLARVVSPYLPTLVNALEDARIDSKMFQTRPGTRKMYEADNKRIFEEGVEGADGTRSLWKDAPLNMQVYVALYAKIIDYNYSEWFAPKIIADLDDGRISELCDMVREATSAKDTFYLGIDFLTRLKELGYCAEDSDPKPEPKPEPEPEPNPQVEDETSTDESGEELYDVQPEGSEDSVPESDSDGNEAEQGGGESSVPDDSSPEESSSGGDDPEASGDEDSTDGSGERGDDTGGRENEPEASSSEGSEEFEDEEESSTPSSSSDPSGLDQGEASSSGEDSGESGGVNVSDDSNESSAPGGDPLHPDPSGDPIDSGVSPEEPGEVLPGDSKDEVQGETSDGDSETPGEYPLDEEETGVRLLEKEENDSIPMGDWRDSERGMKFIHLDEKPEVMEESSKEQSAVDTAIVQGIYFETPSRNITGVREHYYGHPQMVGIQNMSGGWDVSHGFNYGYSLDASGRNMDLTIPESVLGPALLKMRAVFADNKRSGAQKHLKSGRINSRVLGRRAHFEDERLFKRKLLPRKKDYFVQIGWDISSSNFGSNIKLGKRAIMAQATLLSRIGVEFSIIAHSGNYDKPAMFRTEGMDLEVYHLKDADEPFNSEIKKRISEIGPDAANLDGHALEYLRKCVDKRTETDRIILYYSDGKMPAENYDEELVILRREISICKQRGYTLLGVGIRTDSPTKHGLDTVEVNEDADIVHVVRQLERRLSVR
jgi:hypothetical protein